MCDHNQTSGQQAQSDEPLLAVSKAVVLKRNARAVEDLLGILETEAMLGDVLLVFRFVPFVFYSCSG